MTTAFGSSADLPPLRIEPSADPFVALIREATNAVAEDPDSIDGWVKRIMDSGAANAAAQAEELVAYAKTMKAAIKDEGAGG